MAPLSDNYVIDGPIPAPNNTIPSHSSPTTHFHPITHQIRERKLGEYMINLGVPVAVTVSFSNFDSDKKFQTSTYFMLSGLLIGSMAIWDGIALRTIFPRTSNIVEQLGILMVLLSLTGLLGSELPPAFMLVTILSSALCFLPFLIQLSLRALMLVTILCSALCFLPFLIQLSSYNPPDHIQTVAT